MYRSKTITDHGDCSPDQYALGNLYLVGLRTPFMLLNGQHWWLVGIYVVISAAGLLLVCRVSEAGWWQSRR